MEFKAGIEDPSSFLSSWVEQGDCCTWSGVVCDNFTGHVTELHLGWPSSSSWQNSGFSGKLSPSLLELKYLSYLDLSNNNFQGIPVPSFLGSMSGLSSLYLDGAGFGGVIPHQLGNLSQLQQLGLQAGDYVMYSDSLQWISGLHSLEYLDLSNVDLSNATDWLNMIPPVANVNLSLLSALDLYHNDFPRSSLFSWASHLHSLTYLDLGLNHFGGSFPDELQNLTSLRNLFLTSNQFNSSIPNWLYSLHNLENLTIPNCWKAWQRLKAIKLGSNKFSGKIPNSIGYLNNLKSLRFQNLSLTGEIPPSLGNCSRLVSVDLSQNDLEGNIPEWMGQSLPALSILSLGSNKFHGTIPEELCNLQSLQILDLSHNYLNGTLPECVANLTAMVSAAHNTSGTIHLFAGQSYSFPDSQLLVTKGQLMDYSTILNYVRSLDLSRNNLSGEIPKQITSLNALKYLNLSHNSFSGAIPEDLTEMESLECMDLSDNQLSGAIPSSLGSLTFLNHLNLSYNNLGGRIPSSTQLQSFDSSSFTGNRELCGPPLGLNCSIQSGFKDGEEDDKEFAFHWSSGSVFIGFVAGFWAVVGTFVLNQESRKTYFEFVDLMGNKLWNVLIRWLK
ncbi:Receptor-like protein EIX2 [Linum perenne]